MYPIEKPIGRLLSERARFNPFLEAIVGPKRRFNYSEFDQITNQVAHYLLDRGVKKGDRIALFSETNVLFPILFLSSAKIGAIAVPINWRWSPDLILWAIKDTEPQMIFYDDSFKNLVESLNLSQSIVSVQTSYLYDLHPDFESKIRTYPSTYPNVIVSGEDPICITYTSGTTGKPKGVVSTHNNIYAAGITNGSSMEQCSTGFRFLYITPLFHVSGTSLLGFQALWGFTYIFLPQMGPDAILETIDKERVNSVFLPPAFIGMLLPYFYNSESTFNSLREISSGGSTLPRKLVEEYEMLGFRIVQGYGLTENTGTVTFWHPGMGYDSYGSVGKPFLNEIKILDRDTREEVPIGVIGELAVRGPMVFREYWRNPEETKKTFHDGWLLTGDAALIDERGFVHLIDRYKDVIYLSGLDTIFPSQVEKVLQELEEVQEVSLVGIRHERWGELPCAFIVKKEGFEISREQVLQFAHAKLDKHKLMDVIFVDQLPRNPAGKVLKQDLQRLYTSSTL